MMMLSLKYYDIGFALIQSKNLIFKILKSKF